MPVIPEHDREHIKNMLSKEMASPVNMTYFTQKASPLLLPGQEYAFCEDTRKLLEEVASLSDKLKLTVYDFYAQKEKAQEFGVDKIPATVFHKDQDYRIKFYGMPSGYEFATILELIQQMSKGSTPLSQKTREALGKIGQEAHIQVFVTPT